MYTTSVNKMMCNLTVSCVSDYAMYLIQLLSTVTLHKAVILTLSLNHHLWFIPSESNK